ncbi:MAG: hypothetical protein IPG76_18145 [Acidobacteria bacterium]|nr:hypothetical protein [Acidobacteriota bacterium]
MPKKKYLVKLSAEQREELQQLIRRGKTSARKITRARILIKAADGLRPKVNFDETSRQLLKETRPRFQSLPEGLPAMTTNTNGMGRGTSSSIVNRKLVGDTFR